MFRHPDLAELRDKTQEDPRETYANDSGLAYVGLDGTIGCIINGAGLAMASLDMIKLVGGEAANLSRYRRRSFARTGRQFLPRGSS